MTFYAAGRYDGGDDGGPQAQSPKRVYGFYAIASGGNHQVYDGSGTAVAFKAKALARAMYAADNLVAVYGGCCARAMMMVSFPRPWNSDENSS